MGLHILYNFYNLLYVNKKIEIKKYIYKILKHKMNYETFDRNQFHINNNFNNNDIDINNIRTSNSGLSTLEKAANIHANNERYIESMNYLVKDNDNDNDNDKTNMNVKIYRYKFSEEFIEELYKFSKIHQYDNRKDFKEAWEIWVDEKPTLIFKESTRLNKLGYDGDILNKMFTSARYYFRKKRTEKTEPRMRCSYIGMQKEILDAMDTHINMNLSINAHLFKPSIGFTDFCKQHIELLQEEIELLLNRYNISDSDAIKKKIKKTYKNRYFMIINKNS
jgi:hypothetical protein